MDTQYRRAGERVTGRRRYLEEDARRRRKGERKE
jgi:hypothetical protein